MKPNPKLAIVLCILAGGCLDGGPNGPVDVSVPPPTPTPSSEIVIHAGVDGNNSYTRITVEINPEMWHRIVGQAHFFIHYAATFPGGHAGGFAWASPMFTHLSNPKDANSPPTKMSTGGGYMAAIPPGTQALTARAASAPAQGAFGQYANGTAFFHIGGTLPHTVTIRVELPALDAPAVRFGVDPVTLVVGNPPVESSDRTGYTHRSSASGAAASAHSIQYGMLVTAFPGVQENVTAQTGRLYLESARDCAPPGTSGASGLTSASYALSPPLVAGQAFGHYVSNGPCYEGPVGKYQFDLYFRSYRDARPFALAMPFDASRPGINVPPS